MSIELTSEPEQVGEWTERDYEIAHRAANGRMGDGVRCSQIKAALDAVKHRLAPAAPVKAALLSQLAQPAQGPFMLTAEEQRAYRKARDQAEINARYSNAVYPKIQIDLAVELANALDRATKTLAQPAQGLQGIAWSSQARSALHSLRAAVDTSSSQCTVRVADLSAVLFDIQNAPHAQSAQEPLSSELRMLAKRVVELENQLADERSKAWEEHQKLAAAPVSAPEPTRTYEQGRQEAWNELLRHAKAHASVWHEETDEMVWLSLEEPVSAPEPLSDELRRSAEFWARDYGAIRLLAAELLRRCPEPEKKRKTVRELAEELREYVHGYNGTNLLDELVKRAEGGAK